MKPKAESMNDHSDQVPVVANPQTLVGSRAPRTPYGQEMGRCDSDEIDLYDILFALKRQWPWVVVTTALATAIGVGVAFMRPVTYTAQVPIELPSEGIQRHYTLPRIGVGESDGVLIPELAVINNAFILDVLRKKAGTPEFKSSGQILVDLQTLGEPTKVQSSLYDIKGKNPEVMTQRFTELLSQSKAALGLEVAQKLSDRREFDLEAIARLKVQSVEGLENRIKAKEQEIESTKAEIQHKIKSLEMEANLSLQQSLLKLSEERAIERIEIEQKLKALRNVAASKQQELVLLYQDAIAMAEKLDIQENTSIAKAPYLKSQNTENVDQQGLTEKLVNQPLYLRGKKALALELEQLKKLQNPALFVPEIRDLENGLTLISKNAKFEVLKSRAASSAFIDGLPALKAQLEYIDKDPELKALKNQFANKNLVEQNIKEIPLIQADLLNIEKMKQAIQKVELIKVAPPQFERVVGTRAEVVVLVGLMMGLFFGAMLAIVRDGWVRRRSTP